MGPNNQSTTRIVRSLDLMIIYLSYSVRTGSTSTESRSPRHIVLRPLADARPSSTSLNELFPVDSTNFKLARTSVDVIYVFQAYCIAMHREIPGHSKRCVEPLPPLVVYPGQIVRANQLGYSFTIWMNWGDAYVRPFHCYSVCQRIIPERIKGSGGLLVAARVVHAEYA